MNTVSYSEFAGTLCECLDSVIDDSEPLIVAGGRGGSNVVVLCQRDYDNLMENLAVASDSELMDKLRRSAWQLEEGNVVVHDMIDPDA